MAFNKVAQDGAKIATVEPIRSKKDIKNICDWFYSKGWDKYAVLFYFGVSSGLRISDIIGLKVKDVVGTTRIQMREQKTGKIKEFPLNKKLSTLFSDFCAGADDEDFVFQGRQGRQLDRSQVYRRINEACQALNIDANVGTHTMRKTFGYHFYRQYKDITLLQEIFNHTAPDVTKRYIGITQDEINTAYLNFNIDDNLDEYDNLKKLCYSRQRSQRVYAFLSSYLKSGAKKHEDFARILMEVLLAPVLQKSEDEDEDE